MITKLIFRCSSASSCILITDKINFNVKNEKNNFLFTDKAAGDNHKQADQDIDTLKPIHDNSDDTHNYSRQDMKNIKLVDEKDRKQNRKGGYKIKIV